MVVSGLAAALAMGGAGVVGGAGAPQFATTSATSAGALAAATPLPAEIRRVLTRKEMPHNLTAAMMQDGAVQDGAATAPAQPAQPGETAEPSPVATVQDDTPPADETDGGALVVTGETGAPEGDPAEKVNVITYEVADAVDNAVIEPVADAYGSILPEPVRDGVDNFLSNLGEPVNFLHHLLQLKPGKAVKTLGRFVINTTLGIGGLFDIAAKEPFYLEYEPNGLANTLGYYGVGPGPYLYLPLIGSTTVRDLTGRLADLAVLPLAVGKPLNSPYYAIPAGTLNSLNARVDRDAQIEALRDRCGDPYAANRDLYLIQREAEINALKGNYSLERGEMTDRLEFNCDIVLSDTPTGVSEQTDFVRESTTLIESEEAPEAGMEGKAQPDPAPDAPVQPEAAPAPTQPAAPTVTDTLQDDDQQTDSEMDGSDAPAGALDARREELPPAA